MPSQRITPKLGAILLLFKTLFLFMPLGWKILQSPQSNKLMLVGAIFALTEIFRKKLFPYLFQCWPIAIAALLYIATSWMAPDLEEGARPYDLSAVICTLLYGLPAGICLAYWSRGKGRGPVLLGYVLFCLALALAANCLINAADQQRSTWQTDDEINHANPDTAVTYLGFFSVENVVIGIIPMTLFGLVSAILFLVPKWNWQKLVVLVAGTTGLYANVLVATRSTFLVAILTLGFLSIPVFRHHSLGRRGDRTGAVLTALAFLGFVAIAGLVIVNSGQYLHLVDRFSNMSDDTRKDVWAEAVVLIPRYPMGGGISKLKTEPWAHNMFLDFGLTNGYLGMLCMAVAFGFMILVIRRSVRRAGLLSDPLGLLLLTGFVAAFITSLTEPPEASLITYSYIVAAFCLALPRLRMTKALSSHFHREDKVEALSSSVN